MQRSLATLLIDAQFVCFKLEDDLFSHLEKIVGVNQFEDVGFDPHDWDGISVEIQGAVAALILTPEQLQDVWELGFNVVCMHRKDGSKWRALKGA